VGYDNDISHPSGDPQTSSFSSSSSSDSPSLFTKQVPVRTLVGFGQLRPLETNDSDSINYMELASIYVVPQYRHEGIASQIIQALLARVASSSSSSSAASVDRITDSSTSKAAPPTNTMMTASMKPVIIYLLTLRPIVPLYERHGFRVIVPHLSFFRNNDIQSMTTTQSPPPPFYQEIQSSDHNMGTRIMPIQLQMEWIIGSILSKLLGNELVCMMKQT
jgi:GNAT superfamily N-acetyltransferase